MGSAEVEQVRGIWQGLLAALAPPAEIPDWRRGYEELCDGFPIVEGTTIEQVDAGGCPALLVTAPGASGETVISWTHSGGYVFGSAHGYRAFGSALSAASGAQVLLVDYRLAPEANYPAANDDAVSAYRWLLAQGRDPRSIVIGGDSAGGGLALGTLLRLVDENTPLPAAGVLVSPAADLTCSAASMETRAHLDPVATKDMLAGLGALYAGDEPVTNRYLSPALSDLTGLPPLLVMVGTDEVLHDDAHRVVDGVNAAGGNARLVVGEGQAHIWPLFHAILPEGQEAIEEMATFIRTRTSTTVTN